MAKSKYKVKAMDELPSEEELAMEKAEKQEFVAEESKPSEQEVLEATPNKPAKTVGFRSTRYKTAKTQIDRTKTYALTEAVKMLKNMATAKFDETVEVHLVTKEVLGTVEVAYPHSTGKTVKVAVFSDDMIADLDKGITNFDILVASPAQMKSLTKYAKLLGPKGLMPNPKNGTLVADPEKKAKDLASGKTAVKSEKKAPLLHTTVGKISMKPEALEENIQALLNACGQGKIVKAVITSTMSPGIKVAVV